MGGFGSGGHNRSHAGTVGDHRRIGAGHMQRVGVFIEGYQGQWQWTYDGGESHWIQIAFEHGQLILNYRYRVGGGEWQPIRQSISIETRPCRLGGETAQFFCPGCGSYRKYLYGAGPRFLCRICHDLTYQSQREQTEDRAGSRARRLRHKLGVDLGLGGWVGPKPKGMHQRTFDALAAEIYALEEIQEMKLYRMLQQIQQHDKSVSKSVPKAFWS